MTLLPHARELLVAILKSCRLIIFGTSQFSGVKKCHLFPNSNHIWKKHCQHNNSHLFRSHYKFLYKTTVGTVIIVKSQTINRKPLQFGLCQSTVCKMVLLLQLECGTKIFFFLFLLCFYHWKKTRVDTRDRSGYARSFAKLKWTRPDDTTKGQIQILQGNQPTALYSGNAYFRPRHQLH
jgi:hypothetical protein